MQRRTGILAASIAAVALVIGIIIALTVIPARLQRRPVFRSAPPTATSRPALEPGSIAQWTDQFAMLEQRGAWDDLTGLLDAIARSNPAAFAQWNLGYLRARALIEGDHAGEAMRALAPFLQPGSRFRDLALFHRTEIEDDAAASRDRQALIFEFPDALYRDQAIDDETESLSGRGDLHALTAFGEKLMPSAPTARRRDLQAHIVELLVRSGNSGEALDRGLALLRGGTSDDPADRASRALDRADLIGRMSAEQKAMLGDAFYDHRHFDRAVALLSSALPALPKRRDDLVFAIGRSDFGNEQYLQAEQAYMRGANGTRDRKWKATFLFHASRAAQLLGDDAGAERLMTDAIAVPGRYPATTAALTQRIRTRVRQRRFAAAASDLEFLRKAYPRDHALVDGSMAYALGMLSAGNDKAALATLNAIPGALLDRYEPYEIDYWRARALEGSDLPAAFASYLQVLRAPVPTHFAYFARRRLETPALTAKLARELQSRGAQAAALLEAGKFEAARTAETDRILLSSAGHGAELNRLAAIYRQIPAYRAILDLKPEPFPRFPLPENADRTSQLLAMGLFDDAVEAIPDRWPLRPPPSALTQSLALNRGNAARDSIGAVEVLMRSVPDDYLPELLPPIVRELLYPRYFYDAIASNARHFGTDPTLVLSIMREESRFNPRAKSQAAARGLLQFIITTARDIGRDIGLVNVGAEDLYDPVVVIRLGAKYISELSQKFRGDDYQIAAAYNAGPNQVLLWSRLAPAPGDDVFFSSINFDETKFYVQKVMNSYERYREIYEKAGPQGGVREEP